MKEVIHTPVPSVEEEEYHINMGPQHPSTHGVLRLVVTLQGEIVMKLKPHCGYIHRGMEKMCEKDTYPQIIHLTDRMDYLSMHINNHAVCLLVENALQIEVPERVKYIRTIMDELCRIQSHQLWWSSFGMDLGGLTCFFYGLRDREKILDIWEESTGARFLQSYYTPGGLMWDIHPDFQKHTKEFLKYFKKKIRDYEKILSGNVIFRERSRNIGLMTKEEAISYGVTGPSGRGSGFSCDVRKHHPYALYDKVEFREILYEEGDTLARYMVRMDEMYESMHIIDQLIDNIPAGDFSAKMKAVIKLPAGEYYQRVESARGDLGLYCISDGNKTPYRMKFRTPSFSNLSVLDHISRNLKIADLVAIGGSLDLVIPDIDR